MKLTTNRLKGKEKVILLNKEEDNVKNNKKPKNERSRRK